MNIHCKCKRSIIVYYYIDVLQIYTINILSLMSAKWGLQFPCMLLEGVMFLLGRELQGHCVLPRLVASRCPLSWHRTTELYLMYDPHVLRGLLGQVSNLV